LAEWFSDVSSGDVNALQKHLLRGVNIDAVGKNGLSALMCAVSNRAVSVVEFLLDHNANVHHMDSKKITVLHVAAKFNSGLDIMEMIVNAKVEVDSPTIDGQTALHWVCIPNPSLTVSTPKPTRESFRTEAERVVLAKYLFKHGASCSTKDKAGMTPYDHAKKSGFTRVAEFLERCTSTGNYSPIVQILTLADKEKEIGMLKAQIAQLQSSQQHASQLPLVPPIASLAAGISSASSSSSPAVAGAAVAVATVAPPTSAVGTAS